MFCELVKPDPDIFQDDGDNISAIDIINITDLIKRYISNQHTYIANKKKMK
ncbi:MAG: hypothetical protein PHF16_07520 [Atribacterota bacterium]|nr:hypothetical protein [Atribacterota bacterium]